MESVPRFMRPLAYHPNGVGNTIGQPGFSLLPSCCDQDPSLSLWDEQTPLVPLGHVRSPCQVDLGVRARLRTLDPRKADQNPAGPHVQVGLLGEAGQKSPGPRER